MHFQVHTPQYDGSHSDLLPCLHMTDDVLHYIRAVAIASYMNAAYCRTFASTKHTLSACDSRDKTSGTIDRVLTYEV
jgi:hypothetical protein